MNDNEILGGNIEPDPSQDWEALLNMRNWLDSAITAKGAKVLGGGCGMGAADLDIELEGVQFHLDIRPILKG